MPEIEELAAAILHEDAKLIETDMEVAWAREVLADEEKDQTDWSAHRKARHPILRANTEGKLTKALDIIASTPAKTPRGEAIKAKHQACGGAA